jgi:hypothetical protein
MPLQVEKVLDLQLALADAGRFLPVQFSQGGLTNPKPYPGYTRKLTPAGRAVELAKSGQDPDSGSGRDHLAMQNVADDAEVHPGRVVLDRSIRSLYGELPHLI